MTMLLHADLYARMDALMEVHVLRLRSAPALKTLLGIRATFPSVFHHAPTDNVLKENSPIRATAMKAGKAMDPTHIMNGWTLPGNCECDHDPTKDDCACCRHDGCQCTTRAGQSMCVQCGLTYVCENLGSYFNKYDFMVEPMDYRKLTMQKEQ